MKAERNYVFVARCADGSLFTGITNRPEAAVQELNAGHLSRQVRIRLPLSLAYAEEYMNENDAASRVVAIRGMSNSRRERLFAKFDAVAPAENRSAEAHGRGRAVKTALQLTV